MGGVEEGGEGVSTRANWLGKLGTARHCPNTKPWSQSYAEQRLRARVNRDYLKPVLTLAKTVGLELKQNEADALASLAYNVGPGVFEKGRTMGDAIRSRNRDRIADAFLLYDHAGGRVLEGLTRRRRRERELFLKGR
jgi:GH24 family phage-related lysozyme (muramidase)